MEQSDWLWKSGGGEKSVKFIRINQFETRPYSQDIFNSSINQSKYVNNKTSIGPVSWQQQTTQNSFGFTA